MKVRKELTCGQAYRSNYLRAKGELTEAEAISGAKAHSGRLTPSPAWIYATCLTGAVATLTAAEAERSFSWLRLARFTSRTSLLTVELSGAHAAV